ncbi:hypothetical protein AALP_AA4G011900 [Arabis alpina]|nr:hypothetical protein AALP_AA4G011900 [Arabis alpina]
MKEGQVPGRFYNNMKAGHISDTEYWAAEMRGHLGDFLRADDSSARGSVPGELNEPKYLGNASRSKGKGKVDIVDKKAEKKRISAEAKADLEAGRIPAFWIGGTCEILPSEAPVAQSLGVTPPASLHVSSDSAAILPCPAVQIAVNVSQLLPPRASLPPSSRKSSKLSSGSSLSKRRRTTEIINSGSRIISVYEAVVAEKEEQIKPLLTRTDVDATRKELDRQKARADSWEVSAIANRQSADDYAAQVELLKGEKHRLEDEVKKRDVHLEVASNEIAELRASLEKRETRISLEKMVEAEYELSPGLLENYAKEEEEYLAKVESLAADSLGDDILFPTPPPPPAGPP